MTVVAACRSVRALVAPLFVRSMWLVWFLWIPVLPGGCDSTPEGVDVATIRSIEPGPARVATGWDCRPALSLALVAAIAGGALAAGSRPIGVRRGIEIATSVCLWGGLAVAATLDGEGVAAGAAVGVLAAEVLAAALLPWRRALDLLSAWHAGLLTLGLAIVVADAPAALAAGGALGVEVLESGPGVGLAAGCVLILVLAVGIEGIALVVEPLLGVRPEAIGARWLVGGGAAIVVAVAVGSGLVGTLEAPPEVHVYLVCGEERAIESGDGATVSIALGPVAEGMAVLEVDGQSVLLGGDRRSVEVAGWRVSSLGLDGRPGYGHLSIGRIERPPAAPWSTAAYLVQRTSTSLELPGGGILTIAIGDVTDDRTRLRASIGDQVVLAETLVDDGDRLLLTGDGRVYGLDVAVHDARFLDEFEDSVHVEIVEGRTAGARSPDPDLLVLAQRREVVFDPDGRRLTVSIDDVTGGRTRLSIAAGDGTPLVEGAPVAEGSVLEFEADGRTHRVTVVALADELLQATSADDFVVLRFAIVGR